MPVWLDLIASPEEWAESFLLPEAKEVLAVLGGLMVVFSVPSPSEVEHTRQLIRHIGRVVKDGLGGWSWEGVGLAVGVGEGDTEEWDEACAEVGLEFVQLSASQPSRNEFGGESVFFFGCSSALLLLLPHTHTAAEKTGIARVKEALEANDWEQLVDDPVDDLSDFGDFETGVDKASNEDAELDPENLDFGFDKADFEGLKRAIWEAGRDEEAPDTAKTDTKQNDTETTTAGKAPSTEEELDDEEVMKVERMMHKLQAVREAGEGMSQEQRRRMAARAVQEVMKEL